jgi:hypothetical protein
MSLIDFQSQFAAFVSLCLKLKVDLVEQQQKSAKTPSQLTSTPINF